MLKDLCLLNGTSGDEVRVRDYIINEIKEYSTYKVDNLGSVIAYKKGNFISAFDASSLKGDFDELSFRVGKKELILHTVNAGRSADYVLKFDSKTDSFNATLKA